MALYQVILSTQDGHVHELDVRASDAVGAVGTAAHEVHNHQPDAVVTNVHARHVANGTR